MSVFRSLRYAVAALGLLLIVASAAFPAPLRVVCWNLESGESSATRLGKQMETLGVVDIWGFSEVDPGAANQFVDACSKGGGATYKGILGTTGGMDRLQIVYNPTKVQLLESKELMDLNAQTGRAPLLGRFKLLATNEELIFMVNHIHRGSAAKRMEQTLGLRNWVTNQSLPSILTGDWNYDVNPTTLKGNAAFAKWSEGDLTKWIKPTPMRGTHKGSGSVLDFIFVGGTAKTWAATSSVHPLDDDSSDSPTGSDHRPVVGVFNTPLPGPVPGPTPALVRPVVTPPAATDALIAKQKLRNQILKKIDQLDRELIELRRLVRELADD